MGRTSRISHPNGTTMTMAASMAASCAVGSSVRIASRSLRAQLIMAIRPRSHIGPAIPKLENHQKPSGPAGNGIPSQCLKTTWLATAIATVHAAVAGHEYVPSARTIGSVKISVAGRKPASGRRPA